MATSKEKKFWLEFFELYKSKPELWKIRCEDYKDRAKKLLAYNVLVEKCKEIEPLANRDFVAKKISSFRSVYRRELKKVNLSLKSGATSDEVYVPSLWYYKCLSFLKDQEDFMEGGESSISESCGQNSNNADNEDNEIEKVPLTRKKEKQKAFDSDELLELATKRLKQSESLGQDSEFADNGDNEIEKIPSTRKKEKHKASDLDELLELASKRLKQSDEYSQTLANMWAREYGLASEEQKLFAKKAIDDILFEARLGTLHRNSVKINETSVSRPENSQMMFSSNACVPNQTDYTQYYRLHEPSPSNITSSTISPLKIETSDETLTSSGVFPTSHQSTISIEHIFGSQHQSSNNNEA